jgi:hypothetical protein
VRLGELAVDLMAMILHIPTVSINPMLPPYVQIIKQQITLVVRLITTFKEIIPDLF